MCSDVKQIASRRRQWHPTPVLLPGKSHGRRSLVGCSPWGHEESDTTERLHFHFSLSCTGEGKATHSSVLAWRIPGTGEPGGLPSMGSHRVGHDWSDLAAAVGTYGVAWGAQLLALWWPRGVRQRGEKSMTEGIYVYLWLFHVIIQQKLNSNIVKQLYSNFLNELLEKRSKNLFP